MQLEPTSRHDVTTGWQVVLDDLDNVRVLPQAGNKYQLDGISFVRQDAGAITQFELWFRLELMNDKLTLLAAEGQENRLVDMGGIDIQDLQTYLGELGISIPVQQTVPIYFAGRILYEGDLVLLPGDAHPTTYNKLAPDSLLPLSYNLLRLVDPDHD